MKTLLKTFCLCLFCLTCKKEEVQQPECTCQDFTAREESSMKQGIILFPLVIGEYYYLYVPDSTRYIPEYSPSIVICADSTFLHQLKNKGIRDSSWVTFKYATLVGAIKKTAYCTVTSIREEPLPTIRISEIDRL